MKTPKDIGEILKNARQKKNLTIEKVYKATRIQPNVIEALENGTAEEILSQVYVNLFLKKYASFLDINGDSLAREYRAFHRDKEDESLLDMQKKPEILNVDTKKWITFAIFAVLVFLFVFFILFLGIKVRSFYKRRKTVTQATSQQQVAPKIITEDKGLRIFPIPDDKPVILDLQSTNDVWMKVKGDGKVIFEGTLRKGKKKKWTASDKIELWIGRAEALDFSINGTSIGKIGKGNIRNIQIFKRGMKIGNKWLFRAK